MPLDSTRYPPSKKLAAVKTYLRSNQPLRKVARDFNVSYQTLWVWVKRYQKEGAESFKENKDTRRKKDLALEVMLIKEQNPRLTIQEAYRALKKKGVQCSRTAIWHIWKKYGLAKRPVQDPLNPFCRATPETTRGLKQAKQYLHSNDTRAAARLLNSLPCLPPTQILKEIPENLLSPRRKLDRLFTEFDVLSMPDFRKKAYYIGRALERDGHMYSSIIANLLELIPLCVMRNDKRTVTILENLAKKMNGLKDNTLWFMFYANQALTSGISLHITKALEAAKKCRGLVHRLPYPYYQNTFASVLTSLGKFKEAHYYFRKSMNHPNIQVWRAQFELKIACFGNGIAGDYRTCKKTLAKAREIKDMPALSSTYRLVQAHIAFGQGELSDAAQYYLDTMQKASKEELNNRLYGVSVGLAAVANALNKHTEATSYLKKYIPLMKKYGRAREALYLQQLLGIDDAVPRELLQMPPVRLLYLLRKAQRTLKAEDYRKAYRFAKNQEMMGILHRYIMFFPQPVRRLLEKGKNTGLPKAILKFPLFNQTALVYYIKFLGNIVILKQQKYVRARLRPKEQAFLIHLALRADAPGKSILLRDLYDNFWPRSTDPRSLVLHLLVNLKKKLMFPGHLLSISSRYGEQRLINRGLFFTTDYTEFETLLTQAKNVERTGELQYAFRDYARALALLRSAPFEKMYDHWSEQLRQTVLNKAETEARHVAEICNRASEIEAVRKILMKIKAIAPHLKIDAKI